MHNFKRWSILTMLALVAMLALAACGETATPVATTAPATTSAAAATTNAAATTAAAGQTSAAAATGLKGDPNLKGEITVWAWNVAAKSLQEIVPGFNKLYPNVKVNVQDIGRTDVYDKLTTGMAAGGAGLPDVAAIESDHMDIYTTKFPNGLLDLTSKATKYKDQFDPSKWGQSIHNGKIFSMPWDSGPVGMFYRTDYFQKAGVDPNSIQTWDDYIAAGAKIQAANPGVKMAALDFTKDDGLFRMLLQQQGAFYFTPDGKININSPEAVKAMTIIQNANKAGLFTNAEGWDGAVASMKNGKEATRAFGVWWSGTIMDSAPDAKGKWDAMPMPAIEKGGSRATNLGGSTLAIPSTTKNQDAAWAYVEYATATAEAQNTMFKKYGIFPSFIPAYQDAFYSAPNDFFAGKPIWQTFTKLVPDIKPVTYTSDNDKALVAGANAQGAILGGADIKQTLDKAASDLKNQTKRPLAIGG